MRLAGSPLWWITNPSQETDEALESVSPKESGMEFNNLPDDIKEKVALCKSSEELLALVKAEGYELTDDQLEQIAGGDSWFDCTDYCVPLSPTWQ